MSEKRQRNQPYEWNLVSSLSSRLKKSQSSDDVWEQVSKEVEVRKQTATAQRIEDKNRYRTPVLWIFVGIAVVWIVGEYVLLVLSGIEGSKFRLDNSVLIAMMGVGTVNVLGPARYFFANGSNGSRQSPNDT